MAIQFKLIMATSSECYRVDESDTINPHLQVTLTQDREGFYNPYFNHPTNGLVLVDHIEVYYSDSEAGPSTKDFWLRGVTDDSGTVTITEVDHTTSSNFSSRVKWTVDGNRIDWVFLNPPNYGDWASWTFNPSGGAPPVKIKVKLKRQDQPLANCP